MRYGLGDFQGAQGLDTRFYGEIRGKNLSGAGGVGGRPTHRMRQVRDEWGTDSLRVQKNGEWASQGQKQISPLRCGMTSKRTGNGRGQNVDSGFHPSQQAGREPRLCARMTTRGAADGVGGGAAEGIRAMLLGEGVAADFSGLRWGWYGGDCGVSGGVRAVPGAVFQ
jgi:hypothetical protein